MEKEKIIDEVRIWNDFKLAIAICLGLTVLFFITGCLKHQHNFIEGVCECGLEQEINYLEFEISDDQSYYIVKKYITCETKEINIPRLYKGLPVKEIASGAFSGTDIVSVSIPNSVDEIGSQAFQMCMFLTDVKLPNKLSKINRYLFSGCYSLSKIILPATIEQIDDYAFKNSGLVEVNLPWGLLTIGNNAFASCKMIENIVIPNSVSTIGEYAFAFCYNLESIVLPNEITKIESNLFLECIKLRTVNIPNNVVEISDFAFNSCKSLRRLTLPDGLISIGDMAFMNCINLREINIPSTTEVIGNQVFHKCKLLESLYLPSSLNFVGENIITPHVNSKTIIYCEVESKPSTWSESWITDQSIEVVWGTKKV